MSNILCVGIATLDIINEVLDYPSEDDEIRILSQQKRRGGNAANTAVILSQLGHQCYWAGSLLHNQANDPDTRTILNDLDKYHINYDYSQFLKQGKIPTSYIILSQKTASRTITHYRDLAEFSFQSFNAINLKEFDWLHFEARNVKQTHKMMHKSKQLFPKISISLEIEKTREGIEELIPYADIILFSKSYVLEQGCSTANEFFQHNKIAFENKKIFCAWGDSGAAAFIEQRYYWQEAFEVNAIDTIAAGDVFNAAIIDQQSRHQNIKNSLMNACKTAAHSCTKDGIELHLSG